MEADEGFLDQDRHACKEISDYINERDAIRRNPLFLDPLVFWFERRALYPHLFQVALKALGVPATSVLSEQCFSKAGHISTSGRTRLEAETVENLVYLQRSMKPIDIERLTPDAMREERRLLESRRLTKLRQDAYADAVERYHANASEAHARAAEAAERMGAGNDDNWVFGTEQSFNYSDVQIGPVDELDVDERLDDIHETGEVSDLEEEIQQVADRYQYLSASRWASMTPEEQHRYRTDGPTGFDVEG